MFHVYWLRLNKSNFSFKMNAVLYSRPAISNALTLFTFKCIFKTISSLKTIFKIILFYCLLLISPSVFAAEDLITLYHEAECKDSVLQAAKELQLAKREAMPQARSQFLPVLNSQMTWLNNHSTDPVFGSYGTQIYSVNLTQSVLHFDYFKKYAQANEIVKQANATYAAAEQDLMLRTATAYFGVLQAIDNLYFARASVKAFAKFREQTEERYKVGLIAITDFEISKAQHDNAVAEEIAAQNEVYNQKEKLRNIVGHEVNDLFPLREELSFSPPIPADIEKWVMAAIEQNYQLQAARFGALAAKNAIKISDYQHIPTIDIIGQIERSTPITNLPGTRAINSNVGVQVNIPLFQGGYVSSKTRQAIHEYLQNDRMLETLYRTIESNTRIAYRGMLTEISQISALKQALISNQSALEATHASFNVGTRTIVDVLNAQRDLIKAQQFYAAARYSYIIQSLQLKLASGILCEDDLRHINGWLRVPKTTENCTASPAAVAPPPPKK